MSESQRNEQGGRGINGEARLEDGSKGQGDAPSKVTLDGEEVSPLDDDEIEILDDLGNEFDDPEGWMSERVDYWADRPDLVPSKPAMLWHRVAQAIRDYRKCLESIRKTTRQSAADEEDWSRLAEQAFGYGICPTCRQRLPVTARLQLQASEPRP